MGVTDEAKIEEMIKATKEELNNIDQKISAVMTQGQPLFSI